MCLRAFWGFELLGAHQWAHYGQGSRFARALGCHVASAVLKDQSHFLVECTVVSFNLELSFALHLFLARRELENPHQLFLGADRGVLVGNGAGIGTEGNFAQTLLVTLQVLALPLLREVPIKLGY